ncbi:MAG: hypothetical protein U0941_28260 [Planctomycetaceae bacterium]
MLPSTFSTRRQLVQHDDQNVYAAGWLLMHLTITIPVGKFIANDKTGADDREGEAPAEPRSQLEHIDLAARQEPRPPIKLNTRFSFDKPRQEFRATTFR